MRASISPCPAFIARKTNNQALRVKTAAEWSKVFNVALKPEDINCVGCLKTKGVHIGHCASARFASAAWPRR